MIAILTAVVVAAPVPAKAMTPVTITTGAQTAQ
jgi:hypothetical protein